jgi:hypothetical protein
MPDKKTKIKKAYEDLDVLMRTHGKHLPEHVLTHFQVAQGNIARELLNETALERATRGLGSRT